MLADAGNGANCCHPVRRDVTMATLTSPNGPTLHWQGQSVLLHAWLTTGLSSSFEVHSSSDTAISLPSANATHVVSCCCVPGVPSHSATHWTNKAVRRVWFKTCPHPHCLPQTLLIISSVCMFILHSWYNIMYQYTGYILYYYYII